VNRFLLFLPLAFSASALFAQDVQDATHTSTITLSAGGQPYSYNYFDEHSGPVVSGRYEFRLWKYFALETGADMLFPTAHSLQVLPVITPGETLVTIGPGCTACVYVPISQRREVTMLPFGGKGILPLANGRVELFLGAGGAYAWHSDFGQYLNSLLAQGSLGGRFALDRKHRYWLGTSARGYTTGRSNYGSNRQSWISWTADFGIRFGR